MNYQNCYCNGLPYCAPGYCSKLELAHAYVPFQCLGRVYEPARGLDRGTIFPELDRPYGADYEYTVDA